MAGRITRPLKELTEASKQIAEGDLKKRVKIRGKDEIKELSLCFNTMASKLEITIDELKDKNEKMNTVLASIQDGLIALDGEDKIVLINDSAREILDIDCNMEIGISIYQLTINKRIMDEILKAKSSDEMYSGEIEVGIDDKRIIKLSFSNKYSSISIYFHTIYSVTTLIINRNIPNSSVCR